MHDCVSLMGDQFEGKVGDFECLIPIRKVCIPEKAILIRSCKILHGVRGKILQDFGT